MRTLTSLFFALAALFPRGEGAVSIRTDKRVLFAGQDVTVTCKVPRDEANRKIEAYLLPNFSSSSRQLDGEDSAITHRFYFQHVPPDVTSAACQLTDKYDDHRHAIQPLQVVEQ